MQNSLRLGHGKLFAHAGEMGSLWRIQEGVLRLEQVSHDETILVQLAFPGDLVGVESVCAEPYAYTLSALTTCDLVALPVDTDFARYSAVAQGFMQQQERTRDMMRLRTGTAHERLAYFLKLMSRNADGSLRTLERSDMPTLREMGTIIGIAAETVCRELNAFMPAKVYQRQTRQFLNVTVSA